MIEAMNLTMLIGVLFIAIVPVVLVKMSFESSINAVELKELNEVVVPATIEDACSMDEVIAVIEAEENMVNTIDALCNKAMEDIAVCADNNKLSRFGFHSDSLVIKCAVEEELLALTIFTEFRAYSKAKYNEVFEYVESLKAEITKATSVEQEIVQDQIEAVESVKALKEIKEELYDLYKSIEMYRFVRDVIEARISKLAIN